MSGAPPGAAPGAEGKISEELHALLDSRAALENPGRFADVLASALGLPSEQESRVLLALEVVERLRLVYGLLAEAATNAEVKSKIARDVESEFGKVQREAVLRQQLRGYQNRFRQILRGWSGHHGCLYCRTGFTFRADSRADCSVT